MTDPNNAPLRIVTFNNIPPAFQIVRQWAAQAGHTIVLTVTTPGPASRRSEGYKAIVASAPPGHDVLVTTRLRGVALPLVRALAPDLILTFSFPYRLPAELRSLARIGAVNLHPAPLPAYRGPNIFRSIYDGSPELGATLHWMDDEFDTGRILAQRRVALPERLSREWFGAAWAPMVAATIGEGVARAVAGDPGRAQDDAAASYAARFSPEERWLSWGEPALTLHRRCFALNIDADGHGGAFARIDGAEHRILEVTPLEGGAGGRAPGSLIAQGADGLTVACGDGAVRVVAQPLAPAEG